ncbi:MAG TPA: hypothetical protein VF791_13650 [Pyrinomonadaceae bacterium]
MSVKRHLFFLAVAIIASQLYLTIARAQNPTAATQSSPARPEGLQHKIKLQLLVASNAVNAKTDYPPVLDAIVKELKASMPFKNHRLIATYVYNVADGGVLEVSDVTYAQFEMGGALAPKYYTFTIAGVKSTPSGEWVRVSRLRFEFRQRIFVEAARAEGSSNPIQRFENVVNGLSTELSLRDGVPAVVGTMTTGLSDGVLVLVVTADRVDSR